MLSKSQIQRTRTWLRLWPERNCIFQYLSQGGTYTGQDVNQEMISWCQNNLQNEHVTFHHANIFSKVYNPNGKGVKEYEFPAEDSSIDLIVSFSVFSHLLYYRFFIVYQGKCAGARQWWQSPYDTIYNWFIKRSPWWSMDLFSWTWKLLCGESQISGSGSCYKLPTLESMLSANDLFITEIYNKDLHQQTIIANKV